MAQPLPVWMCLHHVRHGWCRLFRMKAHHHAYTTTPRPQTSHGRERSSLWNTQCYLQSPAMGAPFLCAMWNPSATRNLPSWNVVWCHSTYCVYCDDNGHSVFELKLSLLCINVYYQCTSVHVDSSWYVDLDIKYPTLCSKRTHSPTVSRIHTNPKLVCNQALQLQ